MELGIEKKGLGRRALVVRGMVFRFRTNVRNRKGVRAVGGKARLRRDGEKRQGVKRRGVKARCEEAWCEEAWWYRSRLPGSLRQAWCQAPWLSWDSGLGSVRHVCGSRWLSD